MSEYEKATKKQRLERLTYQVQRRDKEIAELRREITELGVQRDGDRARHFACEDAFRATIMRQATHITELGKEVDRLRAELKQTASFALLEAQQNSEMIEVGAEANEEIRALTAALERARSQPNLGHATTRLMLMELRARGEMAYYHKAGTSVADCGRIMEFLASSALRSFPNRLLEYKTVQDEAVPPNS